MSADKYKLLPDLTEEQFAALKEDIDRNGVQVPILLDQDGNIIDGHHREKAAKELGCNCPAVFQRFESEEHKLETVLRLNANRRHLTSNDKLKLITDYLLRDPSIAPNWLGKILGVAGNTARKVREQLVQDGRIPAVDKLRGEDGKLRPTRFRRVLAHNDAERERAAESLVKLPHDDDKTVDLRSAEKLAGRYRRTPDVEINLPDTSDDIRVYHCGFEELRQKAELQPQSISYIGTDIPYNGAFLEYVESLSRVANELLADGGILTTYSGTKFLPEILGGFVTHLNYHWCIASLYSDNCHPPAPVLGCAHGHGLIR